MCQTTEGVLLKDPGADILADNKKEKKGRTGSDAEKALKYTHKRCLSRKRLMAGMYHLGGQGKGRPL